MKANLPTISDRNMNKLFDLLPGADPKPPHAKKPKTKQENSVVKLPTVSSVLAEIKENCDPAAGRSNDEQNKSRDTSLLEIELDITTRELEKKQDQSNYHKEHYSVAKLNTEVLQMETGLPTKEIFLIVVNYVARFKGHINYHAGWKVETISLEDQLFITLMKLKQNYTNLHLAQLFSCSVATIANII